MIPPIGELTAVIGWIYLSPEGVKQLFIGDFFRIIYHLNGFNMRSPATGNLFIGGVGILSTCISCSNINNPLKLLKRRFHTPEATPTKDSNLLFTFTCGNTLSCKR